MVWLHFDRNAIALQPKTIQTTLMRSQCDRSQCKKNHGNEIHHHGGISQDTRTWEGQLSATKLARNYIVPTGASHGLMLLDGGSVW
jgi:hypothetical protein